MKANDKWGIPASAIIGMAIIESGYGITRIAISGGGQNQKIRFATGKRVEEVFLKLASVVLYSGTGFPNGVATKFL